MQYLDDHEGQYFTATQIQQVVGLNKSTVCRQLKKILKREEYIAIFKKTDGVKHTLYYGVKKQ